MAARETLVAGNSTIDADGEFADGFDSGYDYYYDTNYRLTTLQLPRPLTSEVLTRFLRENLQDPNESDHWNLGFVCGWLVALCENNPDRFYSSVLIPEREPVKA